MWYGTVRAFVITSMVLNGGGAAALVTAMAGRRAAAVDPGFRGLRRTAVRIPERGGRADRETICLEGLEAIESER